MSLRASVARLGKAAQHVKILTLDVERSPGRFWSWDPYPRFLSPEKMIEPPRIMSFAAKWLHEKQPIVADERAGHEVMIRQAWELISEADVMVTYNGTRADVKWLNEHFRDYGLGPAAPVKHVDLIKTNRDRWNLPYRRLDYLAGRVLGASKDHTDFQLWLDCLAGDPAAWDRMNRYCVKDVKLTEQLYLELLPWLTDQPHIGSLVADGEGMRCYACGRKLTPKHRWSKPARAYVRSYELFRCECQAWNRSTFLTGTAQFTRPVR